MRNLLRGVALTMSMALLAAVLPGYGNAAAASQQSPSSSPEAEVRTLDSGYVIPEGTLMTASPQSGKAFIYNLENLYVVPGYDVVYLDEYEFELSTAAVATEDGGDVYLALSDLAKIYGPDFHFTQNGKEYTISHAGLTALIQVGSTTVRASTGSFELDNPVVEADGVVSVPALQFLEGAFGKYISSQETTCWDTSACAEGKYEFDKYVSVPITIYAISNYADGDISVSGNAYESVVSGIPTKLRGAKDYGIVYRAFYDERVDKCITTQLYVPTSLYFDSEQELSCIVLFPGANGKASTYNCAASTVDLAETFQYYAEENNYVLVTVESYVNSGQYGDPTGPIGRFPVTHPDDPENPWGKDDGWMADIVLSGEVVMDTLDYALDCYPSINSQKVYAVGVSMGSMGAFSMGINYSDRFAGLVGTAGLTEIDYWDVASIGDKPFLFIGGTEDSNGLDFMLYGIEKLQDMLPNFEYILTGGAVHAAEWKPHAQEIFDWLNAIGEKL